MLANNGGSGNGTYSGVITLNHDLMLGNLSGNGARTLNFSGAFAGTGNLIITNAGVAAGNRANLTGAVTNNGTISNVSLLGDVFITGASSRWWKSPAPVRSPSGRRPWGPIASRPRTRAPDSPP